MEKKSSKRFKKIGGGLLGILLGAGIGFGVGYISTAWFPNASLQEMFFAVPAIIFFTIIGYFIHIILHEAGHLVFGLFSGYKFSSFRVGNTVLYKRDGEFQTGKYSIPGTGGQCLMAPPAFNEGNYPFILYNLGGVLMNLIATFLGGLLFFIDLPAWLYFALAGFILGGLLTAVTNGIPMTIGGIPNDAQNIRVMKADKSLRASFWFQLQANHLLTQGIRPKDLPVEKLSGIAKTDLAQPLHVAIHLIRYNHFLDKYDFSEAERILADFKLYERKMLPLYQNELQFERLFLELIGENRSERVEALYTDELLKHAKTVKGWPNHQRVLMTYEWFHNKDQEKALKYEEELKKIIKTHPVLGESKMELGLTDYIKEHPL